jgi:cbb3-type cytochrome oxidase subunit 3
MIEAIWDFLNSNLFIAIVTLLAGLVAYFIYRKRNKNFKKDAANILLLEIQNAERQLKVAREQMTKNAILVDNAYVMPTESWSKNKYMFVRDFDRDEWDTINSFYEKCGLFDEAVKHKSTSFKNNEFEIRANMHRITANYIKDYIELEEESRDKDKLLKTIDLFQDEYLSLPETLTLYSPQKPINDAKYQLEGLKDDLSLNSVGLKLKKIAKLK